MMQSKTSCFNKALIITDLKRSMIPSMIAVLCGYIVLYLVPGVTVKEGTPDAEQWIFQVLLSMTNPIIIGFFCIAVAISLYMYLYKRRASYMLHSMPISRNAHFFSHYISGFGVMFVTVLICYLATFTINKQPGMSGTIWCCFVETIVQMCLFYSIAVFACIVCGNMILAAATYVVINLLWVFVNYFGALIYYLLVSHPIVTSSGNGFMYMVFEHLDALSPGMYFMKRVGPGMEGMYTAECLLMLIPAVVITVLSWFLYKKLGLERTGETVSFTWCRVVFRVLFTFCGAGIFLMGVLVPINNLIFDRWSGMIYLVVGVLTVGGIASYIISEMLLQKSVHIKNSMHFLQCIVPLGIIILLAIFLKVGVIGPQLVPDADKVERIEIMTDMSDESPLYVFEEKDKIQKIITAHKELIKDPSLLKTARRSNDEGMNESDQCLIMTVYSRENNAMVRNVYYYVYDNDADGKRLMDSFMPYVDQRENVDVKSSDN